MKWREMFLRLGNNLRRHIGLKPIFRLEDLVIKPLEEIEGSISVELKCVECGNPYQFLIRYEGRVVGYYCPGCGAKTYVAK